MRYKILYGGRSAGRSWGCAQALLLIGTQRPIRVLCVRELQKSLADSVHKLLSDQITRLGLDAFYEVQKAKIIGINGTEFSFEGIKNNVNTIRSYEGIDYCWVEEANNVTKNSWKVLTPTIRKEVTIDGVIQNASEIWMTFNPELDTDYTYKKFVLRPPTNSFVVKMTYRDNPWFTQVLKQEMEDDKKNDYESYLNVWEGNCLQMLEGVVFAKQLRQVELAGQITKVPWDRETPVDTFWDLGRRDFTCIWFVQRVGMQYRILDFFEDNGEDIHHFLKECQNKPYTYGTFYLPHDGKNKLLGQKRSVEQIIRAAYPKVVVVPRTAHKANAINAARIVFPNCWFDAENCEDGLFRLRRYKYQVVDGQFSQEPLHDDNSNAADAFMTMAQSIKGPKASKSALIERLHRAKAEFFESHPDRGWMGQ